MKLKESPLLVLSLLIIIGILFNSCNTSRENFLEVNGGEIEIIFNDSLFSKVVSKIDGQEIKIGGFTSSEYLIVDDKIVDVFKLVKSENRDIEDSIGRGKVFNIIGKSEKLEKDISITVYDNFPTVAIFDVKYTNTGKDSIFINKWINNHYKISSTTNLNIIQPQFWSYQSASYEDRPDWVFPLKVGFERKNYQGMNATDYGGGTPVCDLWRKDAGIAVGHLELVPKLVSIPVTMLSKDGAELWVEYDEGKILRPGESFQTFTTFVSIHKKDYFNTLVNYRNLMIKRGITFDKQSLSAYEPIWCAWGYERNFTLTQIYNTLPKVQELGYKWVVLDDGWQTAEGDWFLNSKKFPKGDADMKAFVDKIHSEGFKAELWWAPLAVDPGTNLIKEHPEYMLINKDGSKQEISWWDSYYLCPAYKPVQENARQLVEKMFTVWGFDGLKIDGQHLNAAPPCYNPVHHHQRPEESTEAVPDFFKVIYGEALKLKKDAVIEICPCGTAYSFFTMPYFNQSVASDPTSSYQVRTKGKTLKALIGSDHAFFGDHVELSDNGSDFASTLGIGGVIGTKFTWPPGVYKNKESGDIDLSPGKEKIWKKWIDIYNAKLLPSGHYLGNLYDIGFDKPETHAISKDGKMYYAFYANQWNGEVELRGLENKIYKVIDYVNDKELGNVNGPVAKLKVEFKDYLLVECLPIN